MIRTLILVLASVFLLSSSVSAETLKHKEAKVQFEAPDDWKKSNLERGIKVASPDDRVQANFILLDSTDVKDATKATLTKIQEKYKGFKLDKPKEFTVNGLKGVIIKAAAETETKKGVKLSLNFSLAYVVTPVGKVLHVQVLFPEKLAAKHMDATSKMINSIAPLK